MEKYKLYSSDITPEEEAAGFKLAKITNPEAHYATEPNLVSAVIFAVDGSHRIIKMQAPWGEITYKLQVYGKYAFERENAEASWKPCSELADNNPADAIAHVDFHKAGNPFRDFVTADAPPQDLGNK